MSNNKIQIKLKIEKYKKLIRCIKERVRIKVLDNSGKQKMLNGSLKHRFGFSHRRMKSSIEAFDRSSTNKKFMKTQKPHEILERARTAYKNENFLETVSQLEEYLQYKYLDNEALYICAVSYLHLNEPMEAIQKLQKITNSYPHKQQASLLLAMAYSKVQNSQKSLQVINDCLQRNSRFQQAYSYRGKLYLKFQQYQLAQKDFYYSLKLNPQSFISRVGLGDCYYQQHKYLQALRYYQESLQYLDQKCMQNISDINMKKGICYFGLQKWTQAIKSFEKLTNQQLTSESYYYLGFSYLKVNRKQQGILNLEYCIKLQGKDTQLLVQKAFKILIELYINDYQFYQAINILKLTEPFENRGSCKYWQNFVQGCMLIIKSYFQDGINKLTQIHNLIKKKNQPENRSFSKLQHQNEFMLFAQKSKKQTQTHKKIIYNSRGRKSFSLKHVRKASFGQQPRNKTMFKSIQDKQLAKLTPSKTKDPKLKTFFKTIKRPNHSRVDKQNFTQDQVIFIMPILLKFKAYGQFFISNYLRSLDTYQEYESYMKNIFGKEMNELMYNKIICEAFLLNKTDMFMESLEKLDLAVEEYRKNYQLVPVQPLLYKISTYLKMALPYFFSQPDQNQTGYQYLQHVLDVHSAFDQQLKNHHLSHYYLSIMYYFCEKYQDAQTQLQKTLKIVQECSWKFLYLKGVVEILLQNYYDAVKEFTAGLILDQNPQLYLGRAISFLLQGTRRKQQQLLQKFNQRKKSNRINPSDRHPNQTQQKPHQTNSQVFIQNSFQDLQKFIQLQTNQDKISLWVTKLLFFNQAYDQAGRALEKVQNKCQQLMELEFWIKFYQGEFDQCAQIGNLIIDAFEGKLLTNLDDQKSIFTMKKPQILEILQMNKLHPSYEKWLIILHLFKNQQFSLLIKLLQKLIFDAQNFQDQIQLKYNLGIAYLIQGQKSKAFSFFQNCFGDIDSNEKLKQKIQKIINCDFDQDQCLQDLSEQLCVNGNHRLSYFLPYRSVELNHKGVKRIYLKPSIPFPAFPRPNIHLRATKEFLQGQLQLQVVEKRIEAPWIKRNKEKIQFTEEITDAYTGFLKETKNMAEKAGESMALTNKAYDSKSQDQVEQDD